MALATNQMGGANPWANLLVKGMGQIGQNATTAVGNAAGGDTTMVNPNAIPAGPGYSPSFGGNLQRLMGQMGPGYAAGGGGNFPGQIGGQTSASMAPIFRVLQEFLKRRLTEPAVPPGNMAVK